MTTRRFTQHTSIDVPIEEVDVPSWLFQLIDADYPEASDAHRALGVWKRCDVRGMINVESIGGHLFVQHYTEQAGSTPDRIVMDSPASTMYLLHTLPVNVGIRWIMWVTQDNGNVQFHCTVEVRLHSWLATMGGMIGTFRAVQAHVDEECVGYARSLVDYARKGHQVSSALTGQVTR